MSFTRTDRGKPPIRPDPTASRSARSIALGIMVGLAASPAAFCAADTATAAAGFPPGRVAASFVRTLTQDQRGAMFEVVPGAARFDSVIIGGATYARVSVRGAAVLEPPGRPALPMINLHVAVPEGLSPRLRVVAEEWEDRAAPPPIPIARQIFVADDPKSGPVSEFRTEPDAAIYGGGAAYPLEAASIGSGAPVGEWWVVPIHVRPVRWHPRAGAYRALLRMTVAVDFVPATARELALRPATRPGAQAKAWDRVQRGLVKNYEAARSFPARPRSGAPAVPRSGLRTRLALNPEFKLGVAQTGWTSVSYTTLALTGFPSGIAINLVRVEERGYDDVGDSATITPVPVVARDNNTNDLFDSGDAITFFARSLRDRLGTGNIENRYADTNVYWLTWGASPAPVPGTISGSIGGAATTPVSFRDVIRLEQNNVAYTPPNPEGASPPEAVDYLFWTDGFELDEFDTPIPFVDPDPAEPFRVRARYMGRNGSTHRLNITFQGSSGVTDTLAVDEIFFNDEIYFLDTGFTIPGSHIGPGTNRYRHVGDRQFSSGGPFTPGSFALLDVVEATYNRLYLARNNALRFTSGGTGGLRELRVGGFTSSVIEVYDVTDPLAPLLVSPITVSPTGPTFEAVFRTDATAGERRFAAVVPGSETALGASGVIADAPSALRTPSTFGSGSTARSIIISPGAFLAPANRLADHRRALGYVVEVADVEDVLDEFNGGVKSARAIRRYLRHAYLTWTPRPAYVVLAGDGSLDYRHEIPGSGVDWVPTYMAIETIFGSQGREQVAHDSYYALNLAAIQPSNLDFVPSVALARIPASSAAELNQYVDKVIQYENFQPTDTWRGRQLLFSDDEYSTTINFNANYCFQAQETDFLVASQHLADTTAAGVGGVDVRSDLFNLKDYTDLVPPTSGCKSLQDVRTQLASPGSAYEALVSQINQGGLVFNLQTHANRYLVAHEEVLCNGSPIFCSGQNGPDRVQNVNRPFLLMVWGCHANQFPDGPVFGRLALGSVDSSDALGEQWLLMPNRGAIASLGSSAYEFLQTNAAYNNFVARALYTVPPAPDPAPGEPRQTRWIVGDVMLAAATENAMTFFTQQVMNRTINLLGDPMLRMDALPPRVFEATLDAGPITDNAAFTTDSPTDSLTLVARLRDEVGIESVQLAERDLASGGVAPLDSTTYTVAFTDSSRLAELTGRVRPHVGNYDLQVRGTDVNGRLRVFSLQARTPVRYLANGVEIVNNVFVESGALLRAEVTSPIPLTADSLELVLDGVPISATRAQTDAAGRQWTLESLSGNRRSGSHTLQVAIGGRTSGLDERSFQISSEFTLRGVAVVSQRVQGAGCGGQIFQYELSAGARKVELLLLTVSGRRIASLSLPGQAGYNVYCWNGHDSQGHDAAMGVYFYRLKATDPSGRTVSRQGRMIRSR
jgi:hypothetical protein